MPRCVTFFAPCGCDYYTGCSRTLAAVSLAAVVFAQVRSAAIVMLAACLVFSWQRTGAAEQPAPQQPEALACQDPVAFCEATWPRGSRHVHCFYPQVGRLSDLTPLNCLPELETLHLSNPTRQVPVADLGPLRQQRRLKELGLRGARVSDLSALSGMRELRYLELQDTLVRDVSSLSGLTELRSLNLFQTAVSDVKPLAGLQKLEDLQLGWTQVVDVSPIAKLPALRKLWLWETRVADLEALRGSQLTDLFIDGTAISDLSPLADVPSLKYLGASGTPVSDLTPLFGLKSLRELRIKRTKVSWAQVAELQKRIPGIRVFRSD
jgi:Leucine-rich repeat (LRR) protein